MKNLFFLPFVLLLVMTSCQKEEIITDSSLQISPTFSLQSVQDVLDQIDFDALHTENGILHFNTLEQLHQTINILDVADETYLNFIKEQSDVLPTSEINYDEFFVAKQFINHFNEFRALIFSDKGLTGNTNFFEAISPAIQSILNNYGEAFIGDNYQRFYQNGAYTEITSPSEMQILATRANQSVELRGGCKFGKYEKEVLNFNACGIDYVLYCRAGYYNIAAWDIHRIYAFDNIKKGGVPINVDYIVSKVIGKMTIQCNFEFDVKHPTIYNKNLNADGSVPYWDSCINCNSSFASIYYEKSVTQVENQDYLKAIFRVEIEGCGIRHKEKVVLLIEN